VAVGVAAVLALVSSGCGADVLPSPSDETRELVVGATLEPPSMDPFSNTVASIPQVLLYNVYETLVKVESDGEVTPLLAQAWEVSEDRTEYTFHLNPAAHFASGAPVDAEAVAANLRRLQSSPTLSETLRAQLEVVSGATVVDEHTVQYKLVRPSLMWLYDMSSTLGMIADPAADDIANGPAGSGPFELAQHNRGQSVVLRRNEGYWGNPARFAEVTFRYFTDPNAMNASMLAGDLDIISNLQAPDALAQFADPERFAVVAGTTNGEVVLGLNHDNPALAKLEVRQALTRAIDRKALMDTVWNGQGTLIGSMSVPTDPWYEDLSGTNPFDPEGARQLLADAGEGGLKLRLRVPVVPYALKSAQFVASALRDVGVETVIDELEFSLWAQDVLVGGDYDLTIVSHVEARDLGRFADKTYYWHYGDPAFAQLYRQADESAADDAVATMRQAARRLADDAAAVWLFALPNLVITKPGITGVPPNMATLSFDLTAIACR
jgi:peptide/nickel transport system substrate-binding protein